MGQTVGQIKSQETKQKVIQVSKDFLVLFLSITDNNLQQI